ncbi:Sec23-binding domain of Sec16-domain-containing protein [Microdochium trichocladiopsis]|uniref:Protein transport protein sec16 n=1 Tax=Microdochium trichocladiopsis TaxID=1682393 RepID=A0A9P8YC15_9PEZI|nr:Sec23-binding domain of Sec16-domain-containing protein [Microdochium trichocladiopsis]KAH7033427.1 Sec23-binding domain of Sec16-domain-containing protein [Microdochium trichocladiopsis]
MASEAGAASWHPALMPNSGDDEHKHDHHEEDVHDDTIGQSGSNNGAFLDQLDNEKQDPEAGAWNLSSKEPTADVPTITEEPAASINTSKHASRISFARTVSHDIDFIDDEDTEWNLQRTETDPFKFMPPSDRTNSFPVVPSREAGPFESPASRPRATSQAQEIIQDLEDEEEHDDSFTQAGAPTSSGFEAAAQEESDPSFRPAVGGEVSGADAAGARFEEGLPLIAHDEEEEESEEDEEDAQHKKLGDFGNAFGEDDGAEGDDFFSQVQGSSDQVTSPPTLQRKSTTMAIGGVTGPGKDDNELPSPSEEGPAQDLTEPANNDEQKSGVEGTGDLDAKWAAAFGDDDDEEFLVEPATETKELDPADIFGSDDEGFLDDDDDAAAGAPTTPQIETAPAQPTGPNGRYTPAAGAQPQRPANPYAPQNMAAQVPAQQLPAFATLARGASTPAVSMFAPAPPRPEVPKAQSFADKAKGGYQSPYDLPMDVVKSPKKRSSMQQMSRPSTSSSMAPPTGLPRSASGQSQAAPMAPPPRPGSGQSVHSQHQGNAPKPPALKPSSSGFFEDLPMASPKSRPASRTNYRPAGQPSPQGPPQGPPLPSPLSATGPEATTTQTLPQRQPSGAPTLVAPERVSPYAALSTGSDTKPAAVPAASNRYSPAQTNMLGAANGGVVPPSAMSRYSPAPPGSRASSGAYGAVASGIPPPILAAHQPRTSSPLAHYEISRDLGRNRLPSPAHSDAGGAPLARTNSNQYEPRTNRIPSLPVTQEVEEETTATQAPPMPTNMSPQLRYSNVEARRTPPPVGLQPSMLSPPKRTTANYTPQLVASPGKDANFVPPARSQAGSPGLTRHAQRSSSGHSITSPPLVQSPPITRPNVRARGLSQHLNLVPPTDGRENDPLQRWRGSPVFSWGVGGTYVTSFPKDIPRYGIQSTVPQITRSPGEVKVKHSKDLQPLDERLSKFPGPLKGRSKKKETVAWLATAIEGLEQQQPKNSFQHHVSHEDKRAEERILLYKILKLFIENDGVLEGNANVDKAVRDIISPGVSAPDSSDVSAGADLGMLTSSMTTMQADAVDSTAIEQIRTFLLSGEREKAAWLAVDRRLWGHALLLANTVQTADLYKKVAQEFIKKEVNHPGLGNESLAALYGVLSGNYEESVDELVPSHARAGLQLMSTSPAGADSKDALAGLDKWRETLGLILSNRSLADVQALGSLGNLLSSYGRAEAAHICYLFARQHVVFGGLDDPNAHFVLVGADHKRQADQFAKETEALLLSEVFEYGLSLAGGSTTSQGCPHLAAYKLQHALILAQYGFRDKALQYCDSIYNAMSAQTKRSPYYHAGLETAVDDLMKRLKQAPKEESSSWITKPTSSGMWNRFNKFVAGDDNETAGDGTTGDLGAESGPFARIAGGTPTISRSPSVNNFEMYGSSPVATTMPSMAISSTKAGSRYAPGAPAQLSTSPYEPSASFAGASRSSSDMPRSPYEPSRQSIDGAYVNGNPYTPQTPNSTHQPPSSYGGQESPYAPAQPVGSEAPAANPYASYGGYEPTPQSQPASQQQPETAAASTDSGYQPPSYGFEPPSMNTYSPPTLNTFDSTDSNAVEGAATGGYEPPSYQPSSFEAPSYQPGPEVNADDADDEQPKPKKKSFMDDDDDDFPSMKPREKTKAEKDRENEELVRKVAEQEAQQAAEKAAAKKGGWGFGGWFGGAKREGAETPKAIKAKLGEQSSFVYDPELKRWVNKKAGAEETTAKVATPPPPRGTPPPPNAAMAPPPSASAPPMGPPRSTSTPSPAFGRSASSSSLAPPTGSPGRPAPLQTSASETAAGAGPSLTAPPARPASRLSNASSIDDLLGAAGPRKGGKKPRKSGRYVDVMAK